MVSHAGTGGVRPFLQLLEVQALRGAADRDLLNRVAADDEAAFRVVAERHGPMVFGVCARLLGNRHDAEDALQATFLVLARRAAAVRTSESLASWLHGVARRVALRLRRADRRRATRERATAVADSHTPADALAWAEVRAGLDEELARLPAAYRDVLVLCYLEGLSRDEAAQRLGLDPGAVKGRLERGRRLLGERLVRRGIGLSAGLAGLAVAPAATAALRLARLASDPAAASPRAAALSHEFLKGVAMSKFKLVTAGVLALAVGVGVGTAQPPAPEKPPPARPLGVRLEDPKDTDEAFIRRVSRDLRGTDPTPAEVHFFLANKDANRRATLVDLFVKERTAKADTAATRVAEMAGKYADARAEAERAAMAQKLAEMMKQVRDEDKAARERLEREKEKAAADAKVQQQHLLARMQAAEAEYARAAAEAVVRDAAKRTPPNTAFPQPGSGKNPMPVPPPPVNPSGKIVPPAESKTPTPADPRAKPLQLGFREWSDLTRSAEPKAAPAPAPTVEVLRVRVKLAEVTVREKVLAVTQLEELVKRGTAPAGDLARARLEVERAELHLLEARLTLGQAERAVPPAARP